MYGVVIIFFSCAELRNGVWAKCMFNVFLTETLAFLTDHLGNNCAHGKQRSQESTHL